MRRSRNTGPEALAMRAYALQQTRTLLRRLAFQVSQAGKVCDADSVHDLRVAIRRFTQSLRVFHQYLSKGQARKIRRKLGRVMDLAGAVRDRDITLELVAQAKIAARSPLCIALKHARKEAERELLAAIRRSTRDNFSRKWRTRLEL
jgi:CHAD domain-containing protein